MSEGRFYCPDLPAAKIPEDLARGIEVLEGFSFAGKVGLSQQAGVAINLSFSVVTPSIVAIGAGDSGAIWQLVRHGYPLVGDQALFLVALVPKKTPEILFKVRATAVLEFWEFVQDTLSSEEVELKVPLT